MERVDAVVVGAGVVGLAVARALAISGREVIILEAQNAIGTQTSSRNSEVIHAGIYYPKDSLKALMCVRGRHLLYEFCTHYKVAAKACGKLIVATDSQQLDALRGIQAHAQANGVSDLRWLSQSEALELEPALSCVGALHSPSTGVIDSHGFMLAIQADAESHGAMLALCSELSAMSWSPGGIEMQVADIANPQAPEMSALQADLVVNASGHNAVGLTNQIQGAPRSTEFSAVFTKGNYFRLQGRAPFSRLIYPVPEPGGLGVHLTLDMGGQARFGPDVEQVDRFDYQVNPARSERFYSAIRRYWPALPDAALLPDYSGFRPKLQHTQDFEIDAIGQAGEARIVNLLGIESPGLTSSLAIAERVLALLEA